MSELKSDRTESGLTLRPVAEDAWLVALHLSPQRSATSGDVVVHDLRQRPTIRLEGAFHLLAFHVCRRALQEVAQELGRIDLTELERNRPLNDDAVFVHLGRSLLPFFREGGSSHQHCVDHVLLAMRSHLASTCGGPVHSSSTRQGGLAGWQCSRAVALMSEHLCTGIPQKAVAAACNLSTSAFLRGFTASTGSTPHRWITARRMEGARDLLREGVLPLCDIALAMGFSDQSHFTRVFSQQMGVSPGAWRRAEALSTASRSATLE